MPFTQAFLEWEEATRQKGIEQGIGRGAQQGESRLVLRQLKRRFGELPDTVETIINALSVEQLEELGESLFDFASVDDVVRWLEVHRDD